MRLLCLVSICSLAVFAPFFANAEDVRAGATISYTVPRDAYVTLNITRPDGWVVRELIVCEKQAAGRHEVFWDGRDNHGNLLPPGEYQWRLLHHTGITWDYVTSIGNSGTPPWHTPDRTGGWGGNHGNPLAVATDDTGVYLGWTSTEGPFCVLKRSRDGGTGIWGIHLGPFEGVTHLASNGRFLYGANPKKLRKIDPENGRVLATVDLVMNKPQDEAEPLVIPPGSVTGSFTPEHGERWMGGCLWGMAATDRRVYLSNPWRNIVQVFDAEDLEMLPGEAIEIHRPRGLAVGPDGKLLAISDGKVLVVDPKTAEKQTLISGLEAPQAIARGADGTIYVSEVGSLHQVKKFSAAGKLQATFGRKGGGTDFTDGGEFQPQDFRAPAALAVNTEGDFWVVEDMIPKRIARFSAEGKLEYQGFGSVNYAATVAPNPNDPSEVFSTMWGLFSARVDYENKTWKMGRVLPVRWGEGGIDEPGVGSNPSALFSRDGKTYIWTGSGLVIVEKDHLRPIMYFNPRLPDNGPLGDLAKERNAKPRGWNTDVTIWTDNNGDAAVQADEVQFVPLPRAKHGPQYFGEGGMVDGFTLVTWGYKWKPAEFTQTGVPIYRPEDIVCSDAFDPADFTWASSSPAIDADGNFYGLKNGNDPTLPPGNGFWSGRTSESFVVSYDNDWHTRWIIGRHAATTARPGETYYLWKTDGVLDGCLFVSDVEGIVHIIHQDGFYVQSILKDNRTRPEPGPDIIDVENFSGQVFEHPRTHRKYLYISNSEASSVFELKGLDSVTVGPPHSFTLKEPVASPLARSAAERGEYIIKRLPPSACKAGRDAILPNRGIDWREDVPALLIRRDGKLSAEVRLVWDETTLYVFANVLSDHPFSNTGRGEKSMFDVFRLGDTVELLFGFGPDAPADRTEAVAGDERLIFLGKNGWDSGGVLMRTGAEGNPHTFTGPTGETTIPDVSWIYFWDPPRSRVINRLDGQGYMLLMAIPLERILPQGLQPASLPGSSIRFDAGITWAGGETTKAFWWGRNEKMLATGDDAAEAALHPDGWGQAIFEGQPDRKEETAAIAARRPANFGAPVNIPGPAGSNVAAVQLAWDNASLYARVTVKDDSPMLNNAATPEMMIKNGDVVALCFGGKVVQKIGIAQLGEETSVVAYRPKSEQKKPYTFESPVSRFTMDYVAPLPEVKAALEKTPDGYRADIAVPWSVLGVAPKPGIEIPFDVQVIFSDPAGSVNAFNTWWHSRGAEASCTVDLPTEARLYPDMWGTLMLK